MVWNHSRRVSRCLPVLLGSLALTSEIATAASGGCIAESDRVRARQLGIAPGVLAPGPLNAITDVEGVLVGQTTLIAGDSIRAGATAILPHGGNLYQSKVPVAVCVLNGRARADKLRPSVDCRRSQGRRSGRHPARAPRRHRDRPYGLELQPRLRRLCHQPAHAGKNPSCRERRG